MTCKCRYAVTINMPGYMPDNDPNCCHTLKQAQALAQYELNLYREDGYKVQGTARSRSWYVRNGYQTFHVGVYDVDPQDVSKYCQCDDCRE